MVRLGGKRENEPKGPVDSSKIVSGEDGTDDGWVGYLRGCVRHDEGAIFMTALKDSRRLKAEWQGVSADIIFAARVGGGEPDSVGREGLLGQGPADRVSEDLACSKDLQAVMGGVSMNG